VLNKRDKPIFKAEHAAQWIFLNQIFLDVLIKEKWLKILSSHYKVELKLWMKRNLQ
jgi:hypothetical protein